METWSGQGHIATFSTDAGEQDGHELGKIFDGSAATFWRSKSQTTGGKMYIDFLLKVDVQSVRLLRRPDSFAGNFAVRTTVSVRGEPGSEQLFGSQLKERKEKPWMEWRNFENKGQCSAGGVDIEDVFQLWNGKTYANFDVEEFRRAFGLSGTPATKDEFQDAVQTSKFGNKLFEGTVKIFYSANHGWYARRHPYDKAGSHDWSVGDRIFTKAKLQQGRAPPL